MTKFVKQDKLKQMDKERLEQLRGLVGKTIKTINMDVKLESEDELDPDSEGFDLVFSDGSRLEVYDLSKIYEEPGLGLGWCIDEKRSP